MQEKELKAKIICEVALYMLRKAVRDGVISAVEFEKTAKEFVNEIM